MQMQIITAGHRLLLKMGSYGPILLSEFRLSFCQNTYLRRRLEMVLLFSFRKQQNKWCYLNGKSEINIS